MRPQQQNRRMRGRGNNNNPNRKGPNPLSRNYESNGPDVKIRGSAQQIADKYAALARDAQSAGDRVMAENYLQHAEHYNRIIAAAQAQMPAQHNREQRSDDEDEDRDEFEAANAPAPQQRATQTDDGSGPQPVIEGTPAEVALEQESLSGNNARGERANGVHAASEGTGEPSSRRSRRPRRNGRGRGEGEGETGEAEQKPQGEANAASEQTGSQPELAAASRD